MKRYKLIIAYNGANFFGSQKQEALRTVQSELERVLFEILFVKISTIFSGRTDKGVHALAQVVVFDAIIPFEDEKLFVIINRKLPLDIRVKSCECIENSFNPRFSSKVKTYQFKMKEISNYSVFEYDFYYFVESSIDVEKFNKIVSSVIGTHDFTSFKKSDCTNNEVIKTIYIARIIKHSSEYHFEISGSGFLKNMVRIILEESLRECYGKELEGHIKRRLSNPNIHVHKHLAPAQGLYLKEVFYE
ncbi:MAG: tRNA pseudouridine(38-40) synthase TruA [Fusobacteria bacterium]|nr:tRNA pseudouridine(38-40) synthase TruA [Fusobacteriota bacterium]